MTLPSDLVRILNKHTPENAINVMSERLRALSRERLLMSYDGTVCDRILAHYALSIVPSENITVKCCTRPCMNSDLQADVESFALRYGLDIVYSDADCENNLANNTIGNPQCGRVFAKSEAISLKDRPILLAAGPTTNLDVEYMKREGEISNISVELDQLNMIFLKNSRENSATRGTVLPFHGISNEEIMLMYVQLFNEIPEEWRYSICPLSCYFENNKIALRDSLDQEWVKRIDRFDS